MILARQLCRRNSRFHAFRFFHSSVSSSPSPAFRRFLGFGAPSAFTGVIKRHDQLSLCYLFRACSLTTHVAAEYPVGGIVDVPLAQTGEGIAECELIKWFVQEGDLVEEFQPLCEVQSDKATIEITSRYKGKITSILHTPGEIVKVGETLLKIAVEGLFPSTLSDDLCENESKEHTGQGDSISDPSVIHENSSGGALCTPSVRNLAKQLGINVSDIKGKGKDGRVLKEDVLNYVGGKDSNHLPSNFVHSESLHYEDKVLPMRGYQRAMVKAMTMAASIPHFHYVEEINCAALLKLKSSFQSENSDPSIKHTFLPFLVKSLSMALSRYPLLNSSFNADMHEIILKGPHNIGVAMATPYGLVVPNIKKVQSLSILEITKELSRLQQLALENKLNQEDISGGTMTISNIGAIGGKIGSPLINLPEVAIIAIGRIQKVPHITDDGTVYPVPVMNVNIGADHRVLDGAAVAKFCNEWKSLVEKPELLLLHMR
ncbi:lipoamide acyltransferase component of branched-chain alpha-keto acid dehydrogenase complex, mitochondrial [Silene latifolia]|uniref:lipoamide acyltransferase component of branched-chain alpha-keto acid dehydrogenase complex, mitochondrial n=1 Tax=Silene latifolia TaxID=37657 RepID=UPI003D789711